MISRVTELDGLRGSAILMVMLFHFVHVETSAPVLLAPMVLATSFGWIGVDLFFVLSGFLITGILLESRDSQHYFRTFYWRRALRIFPLYYLAIAVAFWLLPLRNIPGTEQVWYWLHVSNWHTAFYPLVYPLVTHFWSLAIEEQFYFIWPVVVFLFPGDKLWRICVCVIVGALVLRNMGWAQTLNAEYDNFVYRLTPFRMDALAWGGLAAVLVRTPGALSRMTTSRLNLMAAAAATGIMSVLLIGASSDLNIAAITSPHTSVMTRAGYSCIDGLFACFVIKAYLSAGRANWMCRALRTSLLVHFGKYSYCMYVVHTSVSILWVPVRDGLISNALGVLASIGITFLIAAISWKYFESRILRYKDRLPFSRQPMAQRRSRICGSDAC